MSHGAASRAARRRARRRAASTAIGCALLTGARCGSTTPSTSRPVEPTKILCCHLNHVSRVREFQIQLPPAPTYFHKPVSALNSHRGEVVRPSNCRWLNLEGEVAIVIGAVTRNVTVAEAARAHRGVHGRERLRAP